jgi:hypothetical protein
MLGARHAAVPDPISLVSGRRLLEALMSASLLLTEKQVRMARSNLRASAFTWMHPMDFLRLTTRDDAAIERIASHAEPLAVYNAASLSGSLDLPAFLDVDLSEGQYGHVLAHEGRHRAAAVLEAGGNLMPVALVASESARVVEIDPSEFPRQFRGQFRPSVRVKRMGAHGLNSALEFA